MSLEAMSWALSASVGDPVRNFVLVALANHAHKDGRNSWASKDTLAGYVGCSAKTVRRHVQALVADGWIREGDQEQVAHLRADRRPVVYDLAMSDRVRVEWAAAAARGDNLTPRPGVDNPGENTPRGDTALSPRTTVHGGTHGGTSETPRGDTAMSPEPNTNLRTPPNPPASGGPTGCARPGPTPHTNCRGCGTTNRQLAETTKRQAAAERRATEAAETERRRAEAAATRCPTEDRPAELTEAITGVRRLLRGGVAS